MLNSWEIKSWYNQFLDFIFPRFCFQCTTKLESGELFLCGSCLEKLKFVTPDKVEFEYNKSLAEQSYVDLLYSLLLFEKDKPVQKLFHQLKYKEKIGVGSFLGNMMAFYLAEKIGTLKPDYVIPVPLHRIKKIERGYNQSDKIAKKFAEVSGMNYSKKILKRKKYTKSQSMMHSKERKLNIADAFKVNKPDVIIGKTIVVVDDIFTTGSTLQECGRVLKIAGAKKVIALTAALAN